MKQPFIRLTTEPFRKLVLALQHADKAHEIAKPYAYTVDHREIEEA
jgi:hypothetical protein